MHPYRADPSPVLPGTAAEGPLHGRRRESEALSRLVAEVRTGQSRTLVVCGEAGAGKTALLEYLRAQAAGCRIARAVGVESETGLAFAGLHQLCAPFLDRIDRLPGPQRDALRTAFSMRAGAAPDRLAVGLAVLSLLSGVAADRPLVCAVDNAHWLDRASGQALAFVARHLGAAPIAMVFAVRQPGGQHDLAGLPELTVHGLAERDARALLASAVAGPLDEQVRDRIVAESRGNPGAVLDLAGALTPEELAGGFGLPDASAWPSRAEDGFRPRLEGLPAGTRRLLLVAAAEPVRDQLLVWRAAARLGITAEAAAPAAEAGLIEPGDQVQFRHPLIRSAVYRAASRRDRQDAHRALAAATAPGTDPDRRAWHRAHAAPRPDENVAAELERWAGRAQARGGLAAAAAFCARAAELTPRPAGQARRALVAAQAKHEAGAPDAALRLLARACAGPLDEFGHARAEVLRAQLAADPGTCRDTAPRLLAAAKRLEPLHSGLAREAYRDAFQAALTCGRLATSAGMVEVAKAARMAAAPEPARAGDLLLDGLAVLTVEGYDAGTPVLQQALRAFRDAEDSGPDLRWLPLACRMTRAVWDDESWHALSARLTGQTRRAGALAMLPAALADGVAMQLLTGEMGVAVSMAAEADAVARATDSSVGPYGPLLLAAWQGRDAETSALIAGVTAEMAARGEGQWLTAAYWATAVLCNGLGRYDEALDAAGRGAAYPDELGLATWSMAELIEAAARTGAPGRAGTALRRLAETTRASGTDWALGTEARARALMSRGEAAECLYREAIERLGRTRVRAELARAHLLYGEWLRRQNRRVDAREQLRGAYEMLTAMGIQGFADRARRELLATGETVRKRTAETAAELTAQEMQIARLAGDGRTNPEIGVELFISARTVEWHLRKVFAKLAINSRRELRAVLPAR